jgi:superfamily II DNA/RNA helicase
MSLPPAAPAAATFGALGVPDAIARRISARGIAAPFPIQAATLPDALAGRDVSGRAPTGSGKTLAFAIPLVARIRRARPRHPRGLVLAPTRELAIQIATELTWLGGGRKACSVVTLYGGVGYGKQIADLRRGADIAVACPGRLADLVQRGDIHLDDVELVVLDEADRMADMGFLPEVKRLLDQVRADRQTLLFSATLDGDVDVLVRRYQRDPVRHDVEVEDDAAESRHVFWKAERDERVTLAARVVSAEWPAVVFCRTKHGADRLVKQLSREGVSAVAIHGNRSQGQRERALASFSSGKVQALVATDVAARGIHVDDVACVVHYDPPGDAKDYVHRSGRTGRAGAAGVVVTLVGAEQEADVRTMQRHLGLPTTVGRADLADLADDRHAARVGLAAPAPAAAPAKAGRNGGGGNRRRSRGRRPRR